MNARVADHVTAVTATALAALGGAMAVYSGYDDAPGGVLLGILLVTGALAFALRNARRAG